MQSELIFTWRRFFDDQKLSYFARHRFGNHWFLRHLYGYLNVVGVDVLFLGVARIRPGVVQHGRRVPWRTQNKHRDNNGETPSCRFAALTVIELQKLIHDLRIVFVYSQLLQHRHDDLRVSAHERRGGHFAGRTRAATVTTVDDGLSRRKTRVRHCRNPSNWGRNQNNNNNNNNKNNTSATENAKSKRQKTATAGMIIIVDDKGLGCVRVQITGRPTARRVGGFRHVIVRGRRGHRLARSASTFKYSPSRRPAPDRTTAVRRVPETNVPTDYLSDVRSRFSNVTQYTRVYVCVHVIVRL